MLVPRATFRINFWVTLGMFLLSLAGCTSPAAEPASDATMQVVSPALTPEPNSLVTLSPEKTSTASPTPAPEQPVTLLTLTGPITDPRAEVSSMAWFGNTLILVPQYPARFRTAGNDGHVFGLEKVDILAAIAAAQAGEQVTLQPRAIPVSAGDFFSQITGFEGFEALAIAGNKVYLTIESRPGPGMLGYLTTAEIEPDLSELRLSGDLQSIPPQTDLGNLTDEAILLIEDQILTFYEVNGQAVNPDPVAHRFTLDLQPLESLPLPNLEYRLTDVTPLDAANRFYAINYFYPGDTHLAVENEPLSLQYGSGASQQQNPAVERIIAFEWTGNALSLAVEPPILLQLDSGGAARNWEGIARLDGMGFLLVTDSFPGTLLGFVPFPE